MSLEAAEAFIRAGELDDALEALNAHLEAHPDDTDARRLRASVLIHLPGRAGDALADLESLDTPDDHLLKAQALEVLGDTDGALAAVEQAWKQQPDGRSAELLLRLLYRCGEVDRALGILADLPKTWEWLGWSGDFYALRHDDSIASEHFCSALDQLALAEKNAITETQRATLLLKRAEAYRRTKRYADADADYQAAEAIIPDDPMIPFNRGLLAMDQGDLRRALPLCHEALDRAPEALRDHMHNVLKQEPRYQMLASALMG